MKLSLTFVAAVSLIYLVMVRTKSATDERYEHGFAMGVHAAQAAYIHGVPFASEFFTPIPGTEMRYTKMIDLHGIEYETDFTTHQIEQTFAIHHPAILHWCRLWRDGKLKGDWQ